MTAPLVITGAAGFIGHHTVAQARREGCEVRAILRHAHAAPVDWVTDSGITPIEADLADSPILTNGLQGARAVIHAAASLSGDHARDTVQASAALLDAIVRANVPHVVLVSSLSVYDVTTLDDHATLTEDCPLGAAGHDAYATAKLHQEQLFREGAHKHGFSLSILRPGAVFGPNRLFNAHIGPAFGPVLAMIDGGGTVPVCDVALVAQSLVRAAERPQGIEAINILNDALPDRDHFLAAFRKSGWPKFALHVPLGLMRLLARITPDGPAMPGLLSRPSLEARHKPLRYANARMHKRLGPVKMLPFETAMMQAIEIEQDQAR